MNLSIPGASAPSYETQAFEERVIYVYEHVDVVGHKGWVKVGQTKKSRIKGNGQNARIEEQHEAANIQYRVLHVTSATTNLGLPFSDHDIHQELVLRKIPREATQNPNTNKMAEWFQTDLETVIDVIEEFKSNAQMDSAGVITEFDLRAEQSQAIETTTEYYKESTRANSNTPSEFLWNAKPRFGKTLTSYAFAREIGAKKVLVLTNRPAVADSWFGDFKKFDFLEKGQQDGKHRWVFSAAEPIKNRLGNPSGVLTREEYISQLSSDSPVENFVHFVSLQDIKGLNALDKYKANNQWIFHSGGNEKEGLTWDLLIIDESHEGVETSKSLGVLANVNHRFALHLSGTPFKALASNKFDIRQIFNWSYADEQFAKETWSIADGENPYASLPKLNIFTFQLSNALKMSAEEAKSEGTDFAFDLGEFFRVAKIEGEDQFVYYEKVRDFINHLADEKGSYPFSDRTKLDTVRHTFWLLPGVKQCILLKEILSTHEYFKDFDIIVAAGSGDEDKLTKSSLDEVRLRIYGPNGSKHPLETKTITLSCGQLTTGVTVPAWTSVFMLNNIKSPAVYMQTAFRAQNPFEVATSGGETFVKENCFVFDFAPDRILKTIAELAESGSGESRTSREEKVRILINFLPVIAEDEDGSLRELDANDVLTMPLRLVAQEVVKRGFMSNKLFTNIGGIFGAPESVLAIINKMSPEERKKTTHANADTVTNNVRIWEDKDKNIHVNEDIVINTQNGLFVNKKYVEIGSEEAEEVAATILEARRHLSENNIPSRVADPIIARLEKLLPKIGPPTDDESEEKEKPDPAPKKTDKSEEEKVRDRLRGFSRTIPSFLMAYGDATTTIDTFEANIPDETFLELTSITKQEFVQLRDGFDFEETNAKTGETHSGRFDGLFNKAVFNSSIQEFNNKRKELAAYYLAESHGDIFEYIPPQSTNQIFTPISVVKMVLDRLEKSHSDIFMRSDSTFIDLYMKSGLFITETAKRLFVNTREKFASDFDCIKHILEVQLFGLAPSDVLHSITNSYIFGFDESNQIDRKNFANHDLIPEAEAGTLVAKLRELFSLGDEVFRFDAVVGNPPYQETSGKSEEQSSASSKPIYFHFQNSADKIANATALIYPFGAWFDDREKAFGGFGNRILGDGHTVSIDAFEGPDKRAWMRTDVMPRPIFGKINLSAGVAIVVRDNSTNSPTIRFSNRSYSDESLVVDSTEWELLSNDPNFKFGAKLVGPKLSQRVLSKPFGIEANFGVRNPNLVSEAKNAWQDPVKIFVNDKEGSGGRMEQKWADRSSIPKGHELIETWKVTLTSAYPRKSVVNGLPTTENVQMRIEELFDIVEPPSATSRTRLVLHHSTSLQECENFMKYAKTKFFAYLMTVEPNKSAMVGFVIPDQHFSSSSDIDWSKAVEEIDRALFSKYGLSQDEIDLITNRL